MLLNPRRASAASLVVNGDFSNGLNGWNVGGSIFYNNGQVSFADSVTTPTAIFQTSALPAGFAGIDIQLDVFNGLSAIVPQGAARDMLFGTLYLGRQPFGSFLNNGIFDDAIALFDMDSSGFSNLATGAIVGISPKGAGWSRFSLTQGISQTYAGGGYFTLTLQFFDLNGIGSDSVAAVDNVVVTQSVPEPGRALLFAFGGLFQLFKRRRSKGLYS